MSFTVINPATGREGNSYEATSEDEIMAAIEKADAASRDWRLRDFDERARLMKAAARVLRDNKDAYGRLMTEEMGKPIQQGIAEAEKCAVACDYFADNAAKFLASEPAEGSANKTFVTFQPIGVVLAVMPWNFPFWQVFRFAAPALMAGNAGLLKHASNVPGCALAIEDVLRKAGFPEHLFKTLLVGSSAVDAIIAHPLVRAVTLTGSGPAGRSVAKKAGEMLMKSVLELGGADAYLVLEDADIPFAARACASGRLINSGQSCIAAKRFIVVESVLKVFEEAFVKEMADTKVGDPLLPETEVGPLARVDLRDALHEQVEKSIAKGARCLLGGKVPDGPGGLLSADRVDRPASGDAGLRRGIVRPGRLGDPGEGRSGGHLRRQHFRLRSRRRGLHPRPCARGTYRGASHRGRLGVRELDCGLRPEAALWRRQGERLRPGAFPIRHQGIREHQDRCRRGRHRQRPAPQHRVIRAN
jgi:succinate-semialdehyde dehydrogenase/glutarate-semialdehyde dehydrogenase